MRLEMFLNELSLAPMAYGLASAHARAESLVGTMLKAVGLGVNRTLHLPSDFETIPLAPGYFWGAWRADGRVDLDRRRYFLSLTTHNPYLVTRPEEQEAWRGMDCYSGGHEALGLKAAHVADGLAVSLQSAPCWDTSTVTCDIQEVVREEVEARVEQIPHAAKPEHLQTHRTWIGQRLQRAVADGRAVWRQVGAFFPLLRFCKAVEGQMAALPQEALVSVMRGLSTLNTYCAGWQSGRFDLGALGCSASPDSGPTMSKYGAERTFKCPDGRQRTFNWHAKLGRWRIYFDPDAGPGQLLVGYVGKHLQIVSQG